MSKKFVRFLSVLMALAILCTLAVPAAMAAASDAVLLVRGENQIDTNAKSLTYRVAVGNVERLATASLHYELDSACLEQPEVVFLNGFSQLENNVREENGKWIGDVVCFNVAGMTVSAAQDIMTITAATKGAVGQVTVALSNPVFSVYIGDNDEDYVNVDTSNATMKTEIVTPKPVDPVDPDEPDDKPGHGNIPSGPSINGDVSNNTKEFPFKDVYRSDWYYDDVRDAWLNDLIDGVTSTLFQPQKELTVAEAIKLAAVLHQKDNNGTVTLTNGSPNWYDSYVDYAVKNGVIEAKYQKYTTAQMNAPISRAEFVYVLHGAMDNYTVKNQVADNAIPDVKTGDFAATEIYAFYRAGICIGNDKLGTFLPKNTIKRCEVATILNRMYNTGARKFIALP